MTCSSCGAENRGGRKFCSACGAPLSHACPQCGAANDPGDRFCGECGTVLREGTSSQEPRPAPVSERKLVSVLFADLVGFTALSEDRDPEEVRELLSRYFETARTLIERYGGTVEKFIGDAVMAVWGAPVTQEDDAERAVRAGLELVDAVTALGSDVGGGGRTRGSRDRRDGRHARGGGPGIGCRRPREHRSARPNGRDAGNGVRHRRDAPSQQTRRCVYEEHGGMLSS